LKIVYFGGSGAMIAGAQVSDDAPQLRQSTLALVDVSPTVSGPRPIMDSQLSRSLMNKWMNEVYSLTQNIFFMFIVSCFCA
jgi:hypothetical protein